MPLSSRGGIYEGSRLLPQGEESVRSVGSFLKREESVRGSLDGLLCKPRDDNEE